MEACQILFPDYSSYVDNIERHFCIATVCVSSLCQGIIYLKFAGSNICPSGMSNLQAALIENSDLDVMVEIRPFR